MSEFERIIRVHPAYDKRHPDPSKNYGIHGMDIRFILKGEHGATQFLFYTCQHLDHVANELYYASSNRKYNPFLGMGADIGYHSKLPRYEGQSPTHNCEFTGGDCYYDGSSLQADEFKNEFLRGGDEVVWPMLEERYRMWIENNV